MCLDYITRGSKGLRLCQAILQSARGYSLLSGGIFVLWSISFMCDDIFTSLPQVYKPMQDVGRYLSWNPNIFWKWSSLFFGLALIFTSIQTKYHCPKVCMFLILVSVLKYLFMSIGFLHAFFITGIQITTGISYVANFFFGFALLYLSAIRYRAEQAGD